MPAQKVTLIFQASTFVQGTVQRRVAGFSESYYTLNDPKGAGFRSSVLTLANVRLLLCPVSCTMVGWRVGQVDPTGASRQYDDTAPGGQNVENDLPSMALQFTVRGKDTNNQRSMILRGVPDVRILRGEYNPSQAYNAALRQFFRQLIANWKFRARDLSFPKVPINTIDGNGLVTTLKPHGLVNNDLVEVLSTIDSTGHKFSYIARVNGVPGSATTVQILGEGPHPVIISSAKGRIRKLVWTYPGFDITEDEMITPVAINRKCGGPFLKFRGRRTAKR